MGVDTKTTFRLAMNLLYLFNAFADKSEVFDKYVLVAGLLLFFYFSTNSRREKLSLFWTIILSFLVARLVITPVLHFVYYQPHIASLAQLRLLESEQNDWPFPNGHAAFLLAIATAIYLYNKKWGIGFFIVVLFLNISRIGAGVHALSDMLSGMIVGVITAYAIYYFTAKRRVTAVTKV
jgi:undecaprenyl-diphosphatase